MLKKIDHKLLLIILFALFARYWGLKHSFPYIFHPDEATTVRTALGVRFDPNPAHFDWPHLYIYLNYYVYMIFARVRDVLTTLNIRPIISPIFPLMWNDDLVFYFITRVFTATLGALTAIPLYLTGKKVFNKKAGYLAALAIAITPYHSHHSHYTLTDVPMAFFCAWAVYFSVLVLFKKDLKNYLLAGLFVGFAASTKYNGALIALTVVLAHFFRVFSEPKEKITSKLQNLVISGVASVLGFLIGTPYALFDFKTFSRTDGPAGALWQFTNVGDVNFSQHIGQFFNALINKLPDDFGFTLFIVFFICFVYLLTQFTKEKVLANKALWFLVIPSLAFIYYISGFEKVRSHYFFMVYPTLILASACFFSEIVLKPKQAPWTKFILMAGFLVIPALYTLRGSYILSRKDTRIILSEWLEEQQMPVYFDDESLKLLLKSGAKKVDYGMTSFSNKGLYIEADKDSDLDVGVLVFEQDNYLRTGPPIKVYEIH
ncbi:ArnT family glycosyltransferase [Patescibacteria group bacterium]